MTFFLNLALKLSDSQVCFLWLDINASCVDKKCRTIHLMWINLLWKHFSCFQLKRRCLLVQKVLSSIFSFFYFVYIGVLRMIPLPWRNAWNLWLGSCEICVKIPGKKKTFLTGDVIVKVNAIFYCQIIDWKKVVR